MGLKDLCNGILRIAIEMGCTPMVGQVGLGESGGVTRSLAEQA